MFAVSVCGKRSTPKSLKLNTPSTTRNITNMKAKTGRWTQMSERRTKGFSSQQSKTDFTPREVTLWQNKQSMSKVAFLFPGQGSQFAGMGKIWAEVSPDARHIFERADAALGFPISQMCWGGPEEALKLTENTQPAILTASIA